MARITWWWSSAATSTVVVGPASTDNTTWPSRRCGPISRPTRASVCGLTASRMRSASAIASAFEATTRMPSVLSRAARRSARGWLATTCPGSTRPPRSRPAIIASAMTPEPTHAMVRFARGDIAPEDNTGGAAVPDPRVGRSGRWPGRWSLGGVSEPLRLRSGRTGLSPAPRARRTRTGQALPRPPPARGRSRERPGGGPPAGSGRRSITASRPPGRSHARSARHAGSRPAPRTRPSRKAATRASDASPSGPAAHGSPTCRWARSRCATSRSRARSRAALSGSDAWSSPRSASRGEKKPTPAAGSEMRPARSRPSSHRVTMSSSASQAASWMAPRSNSPRRRNQSPGSAGWTDGTPARRGALVVAASTPPGPALVALSAGGAPSVPRPPPRGGTPCCDRAPEPRAQKRVVAGPAETRRAQLRPPLQVLRAARLPVGAAPEAAEAGAVCRHSGGAQQPGAVSGPVPRRPAGPCHRTQPGR